MSHLIPYERRRLTVRNKLRREEVPQVVEPQTAEARVLTRLDRLPEPTRYSGHGPHPVELETTVEHTWREPAKGAARG